MTLPEGPTGVPVPSVALVILDGWGLAPPGPGQRDRAGLRRRSSTSLWARYPHTRLSATGPDVGLPEGQMGNSEVGHLNLGAGAVVKQDLARIDDAVADGSFFENEALRAACAAARDGPARAPAPDRARLRRRRPLRLGAPPRADRARGARAGCPTRRARVHRRARHAARRGRRVSSPSSRAGSPSTAGGIGTV